MSDVNQNRRSGIRCWPVMTHIGPFSEDGPTIEKLHQHIKENGFSLTRRLHEIYMSDIGKVQPSKWKIIARQPMS